ncbi:MAG: SGNH/GDSL hydrolase family protein [Eubacteriales bacterium]|nr:SGNH/GDSL hydrolase family protein [Eubacteriales bacterium]
MNTLWVIGDSTLSSFEDKYYYPRYGYGTMLDKYLDKTITVKNIALSGRSSKSYTTEPEYKELIAGMDKGDFLIIGFGHNDEKTEEDRYTDANGGIDDEGSFAHSLYNNYIEPALKTGCQPVLCTPIVRRTVTDTWTSQQLHITVAAGGFAGGDYPQAIRQLGKALGLPVVDMTEITRKRYEKMGKDETLYLHAWTSDNKMSVDNTHTNIWGARVNAYDVLAVIKEKQVAGLSEHIITDSAANPLSLKEKFLVSNSSYVPTVFSDVLKESSLWKDYVCSDKTVFKGTVFGDIGGADLKENFVLETDDEGNLHMAAKNSIGKIAPVSDGIAMYYRQLDTSVHFILTAQVQINDYFSNDQVSFGLMARDDVYIDYSTADILGDYVAAAPLLLTHEQEAVSCFARKSGVLTFGGKCTRAYKAGDVVELRLESTSDGYAATFGSEKTITGGFDFALTAVDPKHVYVGMFAARNADVTFRNIKLEYK